MPIRVFISSTFRDMHAERDYLSRQVFPELRSRCHKRGAEFIGLDLRWGVTEEEAQREGALKICLDEIERCRPFFVCLLGSRYGWVPPPEEVPLERFADAVSGAPPIALNDWYALDETSAPSVYRLRRDRSIPEAVAESLTRFWEDDGLPNAGESITAREILHGVFVEGLPATHALFYLRNPGVEADIGFPPAFVPVFVEPDPNRRNKLHDLETKVRRCKDRMQDRMIVRDYEASFAGLQVDPSLLPAELSAEEREWLADSAATADHLDGFSAPTRKVIIERGTVALGGLEALGNQILEDLWSAIEKELERPAEILDAHQRERAYHERFVIDRTRLFLGRDEIVTRIMGCVTDPAGANILAVTGEPGSGKSALLAECARRAREHFQGALVIPHFIGASPGSAILTNTLRSICETLKRECSLTEEVPDDPQKLVQKWPEFLEKAGAQRRVILLLDAINQLDPLDRSHELGWLPFRLPPGMTLMVSALPGDCLDRLRHRLDDKAIIDVPVLAASDRKALVETHLGQRRKKLSAAQLDRLLDTTKRPEAGLPLYLLVALEELGLFGSYEALDGRIDLLPPKVAELFDQVLARLEQDHGQDMTASICRWIAVSRSGMLESEILDLLSGPEQVFPRARWSRFYHAIESLLRPVEEKTGEGLLAFYHDQLRFAVYRRYLKMQSPDELPTDTCRTANAELARYFRRCAIEEDVQFPKWRWDRKRSLSELPHHQLSAGLWDDLERTLTDIGFVEAKSRTGMVYDLTRDYAAAERAWPGQEDERSKEGERQRRMKGYVDALIAYSQAHTKHRMRSWVRRLWPRRARPPLPELRTLVPWTSDPEVADVEHQWTPLVRVRAWEHFVSNHVFALALTQEPAFPVAYNSADSGPVAMSVEERLRGNGPSAPWLRLTNRPLYVLYPACLRTLEGHKDNVNAVAVTPDGRLAVSGSGDCTLRVWDLETGYSRVLQGHARYVSAVALTPDGRLAVSGSWDKTLRVWDLETDYSQVLAGHTGEVNSVAVTPDGQRAVSGGQDKIVRIWNLETGLSRALEGHTDYVSAIAITPDGRRAVSGGGDKTVRVWNLETGFSRVLEGHTDSVSAVAITPDGRRAVTGSGDCSLRVWDLDTWECRVLDGHTARLWAVGVTPDGRLAVSVGQDRTLRVWDLILGNSRVLMGHASKSEAVALTPDGRLAVSGCGDCTLRVWDLEMGRCRIREGHAYTVEAVAVTPSGRCAISGSGDWTLRAWDLETGHSRVFEGHTDWVKAVAATPDGRRVVSGSRDHTVRAWDLETGCSRAFEGHTREVNAVALTSDGRHAVSGSGSLLESDDDTLRVWDLETGKCRVLDGDTRAVLAVALTPDGRCAVSGSNDFKLRLWDLETGYSRILQGYTDWQGHLASVQTVAVTPDGRRAISGSNDQTVRLWDLETGHSRVLWGHAFGVIAVAVTPDGRRAVWASGSRDIVYSDHTLRVQDVETGRTVAIHESANDTFNCVAQRFPTVVAGTSSGRVELLRFMGAQEGVPLLGPLITTVARLWLCAPGVFGGSWDEAVTARCEGCGQRFPASPAILDTIAAITRNAGLRAQDSPCLKLPAEAWDEPRLLSECPLCHQPLKFNPFVVDNRDRYPAP